MNAPGVHYPHRIRLRGSWQTAAHGDRIRRVRRFGYPGRIDQYERVWLTFAGLAGRAEVSLNGTPLGSHVGNEPFGFEVTHLLAPRNELVLEVEAGDPGGDVAMEVRRTAFLRNVRASAEGGRVRVAGQVVGSAERRLELYVLLDGRTVYYSTVEPTAEGRPFEVASEEPGRSVRVELIDGGSVWYAVETEC